MTKKYNIMLAEVQFSVKICDNFCLVSSASKLWRLYPAEIKWQSDLKLFCIFY